MINGNPTLPFRAKKGLRQGDPLYTYLFVLAMEYLSRMLKTLKTNIDFNYHPWCETLNVVQLGFVDDLLLFCSGDTISVQLLYECFDQFSQAFGLIAKMNKSSIYFGGVKNRVQQGIIWFLGFLRGELPFKY